MGTFWTTLLATLFIVICVLLIIVILLQKGRGGGLGAALGGIGSTAFGTKVGDVFTWVTIVLTALFLILAIGASLLFRPAMSQVEEPVFTPPAENRILGPQEVTIRVPGADKRTQIYYTLDNSEPTPQSRKYEPRTTVTVKPGTVLKARAFHEGRKPSPIKVGQYQLYVAPATSPATAPAKEPPASAPAKAAPATRSAATAPARLPATAAAH